MPITFSDRLIAWLALLTGLSISTVAIYYSVIGLTAIFAAAFVPVIIMGIVLELGKLVATIWLKHNWQIAPKLIRAYLLIAVIILMIITSMGIFGYLSKAHMDQSVVSGDVQSKIALYDEKIKTEKENIDAARNALSQMDAQVNERLSRSTDDRGAERAVQIRRQQQAERARLQKDIATSQDNIRRLNEERAPIAAEVRKVEAEVGPIKYIAALIYGDNPDNNLLERSVRWVIIFIVIIFDPLAVVLLLASQYSFQSFRERKIESSPLKLGPTEYIPDPKEEEFYSKPDAWVADVGEKPTAEELKDTTEGDSPEKESDVVSTATVTESVPHHPDTHPYLRQGFKYPEWWNHQPLVGKVESLITEDQSKNVEVIEPVVASQLVEESNQDKKTEFDDLGIDWNNLPPDTEYMMVKGERMNVKAARDLYGPKHLVSDYVQNEEQVESGTWHKVITAQEYRNKAEENVSKNNSNNPT